MDYKNKNYRAPFFFNNGHIQSIYPSLFRKVDSVNYKRERIFTPDDDFLDLDWSRNGSNSLVIISHGLEGNSSRAYVKGMVRAFNNKGVDALAWNYRSCSGETNRLLRRYHSGAYDDLGYVVDHVVKTGSYKKISLIGFSVGGNITLIYLGAAGKKLNRLIKSSVVFSVPCDLKDSSIELAKARNFIYMKRFLKMLHEKIRAKMELMPDRINDDNYNLIKNFKEYDDRYTAPENGFKDAEEYWLKCSSRFFIKDIKVPTLIVNAGNDPFLGGDCYPFDEASGNSNVILEVTESGGHVGFIEFNKENLYWSERRALEFILQTV